MSPHKIFQVPSDLCFYLEEEKRMGRTIVFANGCFELLHVGHIRYLREAKALGDRLIVAVNTDDSLRRLKPDRSPTISYLERMEILAALESVDYVVPLVDRTPAGLIALFRPHVHTKGTDYTLDRIPERTIVYSYGGRVELVGGPKERSTTEMLRSIRSTNIETPSIAAFATALSDP